MDNRHLPKKFCVVGRLKGSKRYQLLSHEPLDMYDAIALKHSANDFEDSRIHHYDNAKLAVDALNKEHIGSMSKDMLKNRLEDQIRSAIFMYASVLQVKPKIDEIFVGHENYEVEVTFADNKS